MSRLIVSLMAVSLAIGGVAYASAGDDKGS